MCRNLYKGIRMKSFITLLLFTIGAVSINAQSWENAIGLRGGSQGGVGRLGGGITYKHDFRDFVGEAILQGTRNYTQVTVLGELYRSLDWELGEWFWYYGGGAHLATYTRYIDERTEENTNFGLDGILGLEYNSPDIPIHASLDWKPEFNLTGYTGFYWDGISLSVRFTW